MIMKQQAGWTSLKDMEIVKRVFFVRWWFHYIQWEEDILHRKYPENVSTHDTILFKKKTIGHISELGNLTKIIFGYELFFTCLCQHLHFRIVSCLTIIGKHICLKNDIFKICLGQSVKHKMTAYTGRKCYVFVNIWTLYWILQLQPRCLTSDHVFVFCV